MKSLLASLLLLMVFTNAMAEQVQNFIDYGNGNIVSYTAGAGITGSGSSIASAKSEVNWRTPRGVEVAESILDLAFLTPGDASGTAGGVASVGMSSYLSFGSLTVDPTIPTFIPLLIDWSLIAHTYSDGITGGGIPRASAAVTVSGINTGNGFSKRLDTFQENQTLSSSGRESLLWNSNEIMGVHLASSIQASLSCNNTSCIRGGYAYADPLITIDPDWEFASLYTIEYTMTEIDETFTIEEKVGALPPVASVPEASSIYLLAFGLLGLFGAARRKV